MQDSTPTHRICTRCKIEKPLEAFSKGNKGLYGRKEQCKECIREKWHASSKGKDALHSRGLVIKYGVTQAAYDALYIEQQGCCAICSTHQSALRHRLCLDHCHLTGTVRGLLCKSCNCAIGLLKDNPIHIQNALNYLAQTRETPNAFYPSTDISTTKENYV